MKKERVVDYSLLMYMRQVLRDAENVLLEQVVASLGNPDQDAEQSRSTVDWCIQDIRRQWRCVRQDLLIKKR